MPPAKTSLVIEDSLATRATTTQTGCPCANTTTKFTGHSEHAPVYVLLCWTYAEALCHADYRGHTS